MTGRHLDLGGLDVFADVPPEPVRHVPDRPATADSTRWGTAQFARLAPGRYCTSTRCYCRTCPHWEPLPPVTVRDAFGVRMPRGWQGATW
jgi:hypothetical protein